MIKSIILKFVYLLIIFFLIVNPVASENKIKIELQIENEILTNIDVVGFFIASIGVYRSNYKNN